MSLAVLNVHHRYMDELPVTAFVAPPRAFAVATAMSSCARNTHIGATTGTIVVAAVYTWTNSNVACDISFSNANKTDGSVQWSISKSRTEMATG